MRKKEAVGNHRCSVHFDSYLQFDLYRINAHNFILKDKKKNQDIKMWFHCAQIQGEQTKMD